MISLSVLADSDLHTARLFYVVFADSLFLSQTLHKVHLVSKFLFSCVVSDKLRFLELC